MNNPGRADKLYQQAEDIEHVTSQEMNKRGERLLLFQQGETLDSSREDVGIITVSQSMANLGMIESANGVVLTMFGYSKREMLSKNVSMIVPQPMGAMHDKYLQQFMETGRSVRLMSTLCSQSPLAVSAGKRVVFKLEFLLELIVLPMLTAVDH
jgi:hypothetical protein